MAFGSVAALMKRLLLVATLAFACAGCAHFSAKPLNASHSAAKLSGRRLAAKTWTLKALVDEAVRNHPDVAMARAQYATAKAAVRTAGERPNPTLLLTPQIVTPLDWMAGTYGVELDWTFETAGKRAKRGDVARANVNAAACRVVDATWKVRAAVRKAMLDLHAAERRASLLAAAIAKQEELLKLIDARVKAGAVSHIEMAQPRLLLVQLRMQQADAGKSAALARASLAEALGMSTAGLGDARFSFAAFESTKGLSSSHRRAALTHRADVLAALSDYAAAEAALRLEIAKQYPDIHLNPGYQLDAGANKWGLGIGLTLPILNQNKGAIGEAEAKRREAAAKFNVVQAKALAECDRAAASVNAARVKLATADNLIAEQQRQFETEKRLVAAGEGDKLTLLTAEVERATTEITRLDAATELQAALGAIEEATQSPRGK
jgi:outer membrane protein TolC